MYALREVLFQPPLYHCFLLTLRAAMTPALSHGAPEKRTGRRETIAKPFRVHTIMYFCWRLLMRGLGAAPGCRTYDW